jgi:hypothetical protein
LLIKLFSARCLTPISTKKVVDMNFSKSVWLFSLFSGVCSSALLHCVFNPQPVVAQEVIPLPKQANQDDTWTCGANSASRVLKYYGHNVSYPEVRGVAQKDHGIIPTEVCIGGGKTCIPWTNICTEKPKECFNTSTLKTGLESEEVRKILARWEGGNAKLSTRASFEDLKARVREGKPVIVLKRVGSFQPGKRELGVKLFGTWPAMHWVTVHGFNEGAQRIYYTDTETNSRVEDQSYSDFLSQWDWRIGDGLANETIWGKGIRPKTMVWVDRSISAQTSPSVSESSSELGFYRQQNRPEVYLKYRSAFYCHVQNEEQMGAFGGFDKVQVSSSLNLAGKNTGDCGWPNGFFRRSNQPQVYRMYGGGIPEFNIGDSFCHVANEAQMNAFGGFGQVRVVPPSSDLGRGRAFSGDCPNS